MRYNDVAMVRDEVKGYYDLTLDDSGDFEKVDSFDTAILLSVIGSDRRASAAEVPESFRRRGWIGDINGKVELGSKLWLIYQARLTRNTMNRARDYLQQALQWLVDFEYISEVLVTTERDLGTNTLTAQIKLIRFDSQVESRNFVLWENTGA